MKKVTQRCTIKICITVNLAQVTNIAACTRVLYYHACLNFLCYFLFFKKKKVNRVFDY